MVLPLSDFSEEQVRATNATFQAKEGGIDMGSLGTTTSRSFSPEPQFTTAETPTVSPPLESTQLSQSAIPSHSSISVANSV